MLKLLFLCIAIFAVETIWFGPTVTPAHAEASGDQTKPLTKDLDDNADFYSKMDMIENLALLKAMTDEDVARLVKSQPVAETAPASQDQTSGEKK